MSEIKILICSFFNISRVSMRTHFGGQNQIVSKGDDFNLLQNMFLNRTKDQY